MRIFVAYILTCFALVFNSCILSKPVLNKLEKNHDYQNSKQITIKLKEEIQPNYDNTLQNVEYIDKKLKNSGDFNYKISFTENGIINLLFVENNKKFNYANDFLTNKDFELCFAEDKEENCQIINNSNDWNTTIEKSNSTIDNSAKLIISIPENEKFHVHEIYQKNLQFFNKIINNVKNNSFKNIDSGFYIKTKFENGKTQKKILDYGNFYLNKDDLNKFQIVFNNDDKDVNDVYYYEKLWNSKHEKYNYKIINNNNIHTSINESNFNIKIFVFLLIGLIFVFLILAFFYRLYAIATITVILLQTFLIILCFVFTKQIFNFKTFVGLIITIFTTLIINIIYNNDFCKKTDNIHNFENINKRINSIINGISIIYVFLSCATYLIEPKNVNNFGISTIFFLNSIVSFIINKFILKELIYFVNQSFFVKNYKIIKNRKNNLVQKTENKKFFLKKESSIFIIFSILFLAGFVLTINFETFFNKNLFENRVFKNNIQFSFINNDNNNSPVSIPYLLKELEQIKQIRYDQNDIRQYDNYIKKKNKLFKCHNLIISIKNNYFNNNIKNKLEELGKKINANITIKKEYLYNNETFFKKILFIPIITISLFCFYLFILRKYQFSQIISTFFITSIISIIPLIFISLTFISVEPCLIITSMVISMFFSLITCFYIMLNNNDNRILNSSENHSNILLKTINESWKFIVISLIVTNALFFSLSFLNKLTMILLASLIGLLITIFTIKHFFVLISNGIDTITVFLFSKLFSKNKKNSILTKENKTLNNKNQISEEIFAGIND